VSVCERCAEPLQPNSLHICDADLPLMRLHAARVQPTAGIGRIVVGHREGSRKIRELADLFGIHCVAVRKCYAGCGHLVYFASGGIDAVQERDAEVVCTECKELHYPELMAAI